MAKGARRGCVRLQGAAIGIDDEDDSTFTIRVDRRTFHFQARDSNERERWVRGLEDTILRHSALQNRGQIISNVLCDYSDSPNPMNHFDPRLTEADAYLQLLIQQVANLEARAESADSADKAFLNSIITNAKILLETIKHTIVLLQIAKNSSQPTEHTSSPKSGEVGWTILNEAGDSFVEKVPSNRFEQLVETEKVETEAVVGSYSTSGEEEEDEEEWSIGEEEGEDENAFFDAPSHVTSTTPGSSPPSQLEEEEGASSSMSGKRSPSNGGPPRGSARDPSSLSQSAVPPRQQRPPPQRRGGPPPPQRSHAGRPGPGTSGSALSSVPAEQVPPIELPPTAPKNMNIRELDAIYEDEEEEDFAASMEGQRGVLSHLLSQVRIGMDLTKVTLPTFILERRSLLEMYADFFAHPDLFCSIVDHGSPEKRIIEVVRWYLSAFHAGRRSEVAKKPYNPILGEMFRCHWPTPLRPGTKRSDKRATDGPVPWASVDDLTFIAEQVSHHPPVSAFYAECVSKGIACSAHIWTKSKFLGMSVGVHNVGQGCINFLKYDEEYTCDFPSAYGRSIFTVPWIELGGNVTINCPKTGYTATIVFQTKPMLGGKKNQINADIFRPNQKSAFLTIAGEWNGCMTYTNENGEENVFIDVNSINTTKKVVKPVAEQQVNESRRLWKDVTYALKMKDVNAATEAKQKLEQKQRDEAKERKEKNIQWKTKLFSESGDNWLYNASLLKQERERVNSATTITDGA